jgi:hypothetical protein
MGAAITPPTRMASTNGASIPCVPRPNRNPALAASVTSSSDADTEPIT